MVKEVSYGYRNPKNPRPRQTKVALVLGRFQPLHIGHKTLMTASRLPVVIGLVRGKNSDPLKNPLSEELQREVISEVAASNVVHTEVFANAALDVILDKLRDSGFELTEVYCGSDRFDSYKKQAALYPPLMNGHVTVKLLDRDDEAGGDLIDESGTVVVSRVTATRVRSLIHEGDYQTTAKVMPGLKRSTFDKMRASIG